MDRMAERERPTPTSVLINLLLPSLSRVYRSWCSPWSNPLPTASLDFRIRFGFASPANVPDTDDRFPRVAGLVSPPRRSVVCIVSSILMRRGRKDSADKSDTLARVCISRCEPMGNELTGLLRGVLRNSVRLLNNKRRLLNNKRKFDSGRGWSI